MKTSVIYVGGFPECTSERHLHALLQPYGIVRAAQIIRHKHNAKSAGYGFVEMESEAYARAAIQALEGSLYEGQRLRLYLTPYAPGVRSETVNV